MNNYTVYIHRNKINNKVYIGITKQKPEERWRHDGFGYKSQLKFWRAIQKYGWDNFEHIIFAEKLTELEASFLEQDLINKFNAIENGYNVSPGGSTTNHSKETLEKMRKSMTGKTQTQQTKNKISNSQYHNNIKLQVYCVEKIKYIIVLLKPLKKLEQINHQFLEYVKEFKKLLEVTIGVILTNNLNFLQINVINLFIA